jgi:hypothetical protein
MQLIGPRRGALILLMLLLGCTVSLGQKIKTEFDKSVDFSQFHTYSWRRHPVFEKHPELQEQFSVGIDLIRSAVNQGLTSKGFLPVEESPDFYVTFFITAKGVQDASYAEGMLVLDFVDASTKEVAWRAYCRDEIREMTTRHENIEKTVKKALKKFPPKP